MTTVKPGSALALLLLFALVGCGPARPVPPAAGTPTDAVPSSPEATTVPGTPTGQPAPTPPTTTASADPRPAPTNVRVSVTRSGGFAGRQDTVTVEPDGRWSRVARGTAPRTGRLTDAQLSRLRALLADRKLAGEAGSRTNSRCRDAYAYTVSAGPVTVTYPDCPSDGGIPPVSGAIASLVFDATE